MPYRIINKSYVLLKSANTASFFIKFNCKRRTGTYRLVLNVLCVT